MLLRVVYPGLKDATAPEEELEALVFLTSTVEPDEDSSVTLRTSLIWIF